MSNKPSKISSFISALLLFLSLIGYILLVFHTERTAFAPLMLLYTALFALFLIFFRRNKHYTMGISAAIVFRLVLLFALPNLSDDFYRFYWDGQLLANGISPFAFTPSDWMVNLQALDNSLLAENLSPLFSQLNSPEYFTIYPPVCQFVFWVSAKLFPSNIIGAVFVMKFFIFLFELGSLFFLTQLLRHWKLRPNLIFLYALNPLIIIELMGNIHFEAAMICFSLMAVWLLIKRWFSLSAVAMVLAICSKLLPLIFLPFLIKRLFFFSNKAQQENIEKTTHPTPTLPIANALGKLPSNMLDWKYYLPLLQYFAIVGIGVLALFSMIMSIEEVKNILSSIDLYFRSFEFNASIYYIVRQVGYSIKGWNIIQTAGPALGALTFFSILGLALLEKKKSYASLFRMMLLSLSAYLLFTTIVHPWYLTPLVAFCIFTNFRYPILWSFLVMLTYFTYQTSAYHENLYLVAIEYILLLIFIVYELLCQQKANHYVNQFTKLEEGCFINRF